MLFDSKSNVGVPRLLTVIVYDFAIIGSIKQHEWCKCMRDVLRLNLPWALLKDKLVASDENGDILYISCVEGYKFNSAVPQVIHFIFMICSHL